MSGYDFRIYGFKDGISGAKCGYCRATNYKISGPDEAGEYTYSCNNCGKSASGATKEAAQAALAELPSRVLG